MTVLQTIRHYYKPIQPAIKVGNELIIYREIQPEKGVENFIYCFWQLRTEAILEEPFLYRVVSDGCIDIFFNHKNPTENYVMGFCRKYTEFPVGNEFDYIGIRFLPAALPLLFGIDAKTLSNQDQELKPLLPNFSNWIETELRANQRFEIIAVLLTHKLKTIIERQTFDLDIRFYNSLNLIFEKKGYLNTETDLSNGLSSRQLRRLFNFYIGTSPKAFSNVVRFQHILNAKPTRHSLKESKCYYEVGFYDQAHFIKHFKTFYGVTPSEAFR
ncbi:helix-turn-helix domain-containing protein [Membranicola marinus]|uniref:Helix-turn-helix domain-containing protein n=1 Tax=Membranihabitans marinus TaxID=1227546 RepID=A0A953HJK2_9BACT|nr:helix-turn-helix domain-containing protein [Membranihabitans marinus]MBY5957054.1 helix-turn-helix domain-containing protein [Membranihabitans marinus]